MPRTPFRSPKSSSKKPRTACRNAFNDPTARVPNARPKHVSSRSAIRCEQLRLHGATPPRPRHCTRSLPAMELSTCNGHYRDQPSRIILRQYWEHHRKAYNTDGHPIEKDTIGCSRCTNATTDSASYELTLSRAQSWSQSQVHDTFSAHPPSKLSHRTLPPTFYLIKRDPIQPSASTQPETTWYLD